MTIPVRTKTIKAIIAHNVHPKPVSMVTVGEDDDRDDVAGWAVGVTEISFPFPCTVDVTFDDEGDVSDDTPADGAMPAVDVLDVDGGITDGALFDCPAPVFVGGFVTTTTVGAVADWTTVVARDIVPQVPIIWQAKTP